MRFEFWWEVYLKMREYVLSVSEADRVIDKMLTFKGSSISDKRAKMLLECVLVGAVKHGFYFDGLEWPMVMTRPGVPFPKEIADRNYQQLNLDVAKTISFTWTADTVNAPVKLRDYYADRPTTKELIYGLCQQLLADGVFETESVWSILVRNTVAGWFSPEMVTNEWELKALVCLIDYFQNNSRRDELYPPLDTYLREATPNRIKMHREIIKLVRKVDWARKLKDPEMDYLEWDKSAHGPTSDEDKENVQYILNAGWESLIL